MVAALLLERFMQEGKNKVASLTKLLHTMWIIFFFFIFHFCFCFGLLDGGSVLDFLFSNSHFQQLKFLFCRVLYRVIVSNLMVKVLEIIVVNLFWKSWVDTLDSNLISLVLLFFLCFKMINCIFWSSNQCSSLWRTVQKYRYFVHMSAQVPDYIIILMVLHKSF